MIETLTQNIELIQAGLSALSIPAFILVVTSLLKKVEMYTPYIAVAIGITLGLIVAIQFVGISIMSIISGVIYGTIAGASAVGIKVIADGAPAPEEYDWE